MITAGEKVVLLLLLVVVGGGGLMIVVVAALAVQRVSRTHPHLNSHH